MAQLEASLLFAEAKRNRATPLPALSERISFAILRVSDALSTLMDGYAQAHTLWPVVSAQLPPSLAASEHAPKLPQALPWEYQKSTIVKSLASRLVYREGLDFIEAMADERLPAFALAYLEEEQRVISLADEVASSGHDFAREVELLLLRGGVRVAAEKAAEPRAAGDTAPRGMQALIERAVGGDGGKPDHRQLVAALSRRGQQRVQRRRSQADGEDGQVAEDETAWNAPA